MRALLAFGLGACGWSAGGARPFTGGTLELLGAAGSELALGTALGALAAFPFEAARAAGRLADTLRGATLAELHANPQRQRESATGDLLSWSLLAAAASGGGQRLVLSALLSTFQSLPAGAGFARSALLEGGLTMTTELAACALAAGAPAAVGVLVAEMALAVVAHAAPSLAAPSATSPLRASLGLAAVALPAAAIGGRLAGSVALAAAALRTAVSPAGVVSP